MVQNTLYVVPDPQFLRWLYCPVTCKTQLQEALFPGGSAVKYLPANAGDLSSVPGLGRSPGEGNGNPHQYSCLENPHGQRSLAGYSPWGHKESDTTE